MQHHRDVTPVFMPPAVPEVSEGRVLLIPSRVLAGVKMLVSTIVSVILISTFGAQSVRVIGMSMAPTLEDQDRLIVNKLIYCFGEARRGDIVMFYFPVDPQQSFVKRVIAEEGDMVSIVNGRVDVNGVELDDTYVAPQFRSYDDWGPQQVPVGYDFVMGDHRNGSSDSREWGMVPKKYIIGKVLARWWPVFTAKVF